MRELLINTWRSKTLNLDYDAGRSITINSNETWTHSRVIHGDITINSGATLTVECLLRLSPGTRIYVKEGAKLVIDGGHLTTKHNSCGGRDMWQGIFVEGDPSKSQTAANQGTLEVYNSIIEYAMNAISTSYHSQSGTYGGIVQLEDSDFINNKRSLEFMQYSNSNISYIDNCTFDYTSDYPLGTTIQHITMWDVRDVEITDCTFSNDSGIQTDAIYTIDAGLTVQDCDFSGLYRGIYVTNSGSSLKTLTATGNTFDVVHDGIYVSAVDNSVLSSNTFTVGNVSGSLISGLYMGNSTDYEISENTFNGVTQSITTIGSWVSNSGEDPNQVYKNIYDNLYYGNYATLKNRDYSDPTEGLQYLCNENDDNKYDFFVSNPPGTLVEGIADYQGSASQAAGNVFTQAGTPTGSDFNNPTNWTVSYWYDSGIAAEEPLNYVNITPISTSNSNSCSSMMALYLPPGIELEAAATRYQENDHLAKEYQAAYAKDPTDKAAAAEAARYKLQAQQSLKQIIYASLQSEEIDWAKVRNWLEKKGSLYSYYQVADMLVQNNKSQEALTHLEKAFALPDNEVDSKDLEVYIELKKLLHQWKTAGKSLAALNKKEVLQLQDIADKYQGRGSAQAQNILNFWYGYTYMPKYFGGEGEATEKAYPVPGTVAPPKTDFRIAPNPAEDLLTINYSFGAIENGSLQFSLIDIFGKQLKSLTLSGVKGTETVDISDLPGGLYIASFYQNGALMKSIKVVVKD